MIEIDIIPAPGLLTTQQSAKDPAWLRAHHYDWLSFQAYNPRDGGKKDFDLDPARRAGLSPGVWGVTYGVNNMPDAATFFADGKALGEQAVRLGAEHVIVDAEMCAKNTRANRGLSPIVRGLRAGGWTGPVNWSPLGAPANARTASNPGGNDFACDEQSFLETGGGVLPQAYVNLAPEYDPALCIAYWEACGVPFSRINVMIDLAAEGKPRIDGAGWYRILVNADVIRNFSIYMVEFLEPYDLEGLDALSATPAPVDPAVCNANIAAEADRWLSQFTDTKPLTRLRNIKRIATTTDSEWVAVRQDVADALDGKITALRTELDTANADLLAARAALTAAEAKIAAAQRDLS